MGFQRRHKSHTPDSQKSRYGPSGRLSKEDKEDQLTLSLYLEILHLHNVVLLDKNNMDLQRVGTTYTGRNNLKNMVFWKLDVGSVDVDIRRSLEETDSSRLECPFKTNKECRIKRP
ncbi:hypothetical protein TNCV_2999481 [Trichonephila clavipes]|nr:hypothetical protein TNCV_2999481 [Trichonephila clavipes]